MAWDKEFWQMSCTKDLTNGMHKESLFLCTLVLHMWIANITGMSVQKTLWMTNKHNRWGCKLMRRIRFKSAWPLVFMVQTWIPSEFQFQRHKKPQHHLQIETVSQTMHWTLSSETKTLYVPIVVWSAKVRDNHRGHVQWAQSGNMFAWLMSNTTVRSKPWWVLSLILVIHQHKLFLNLSYNYEYDVVTKGQLDVPYLSQIPVTKQNNPCCCCHLSPERFSVFDQWLQQLHCGVPQ